MVFAFKPVKNIFKYARPHVNLLLVTFMLI